MIFAALELFSKKIIQSQAKGGSSVDTELDDQRFKKRMLKIYKAMTLLEQYKHLEPNMSQSIHPLCKIFYEEHKALKSSENGSIHENISLNGSDISFAHSALIPVAAKSELPTISENDVK